MQNYIQRIRSKLGRESFIHPAGRIIIENEQGEVLVIERMDNGEVGIPAGALEEGETIEACVRREVWEETGLQIGELTVIGISSNPEREFVQYPNGDQIQYMTVEFYSNNWTGKIDIQDKLEVKRAKFVKTEELYQLPGNERSALESLHYFRETGRIMLK